MSEAFNLLVISFGLLALWVLWFYFVKEQRVDALREELFCIRRDLFLLAANGEIPFESKAYRDLTNLINGTLRFAHRISFRATLVAWRVAELNPDKTNMAEQWRKSLQDSPIEVRFKLQALEKRVFRAYMRHLVNGSLILTFVESVHIAGSVARTLYADMHLRRRRSTFDLVDRAFNNIANNINTQALQEQAYRDQSNPTDMLLV